jgi:hypothetical protein
VDKKTVIGLCARCEHRAQFIESGRRPRYQCGDLKFNSGNCYMFQPVAPLVVRRASGEKRPLFIGWGMSGRVEPVRIAECDYVAGVVGKDLVIFAKPHCRPVAKPSVKRTILRRGQK